MTVTCLADLRFASLQIEDSEVSHTRISLELLTTAYELYKRGEVPAGRLLQHLTSLMAHEHLVAGDAAHAQQLLESIAGACPRPSSLASADHPTLA